MVIAVNTRFLRKDPQSGIGYFTRAVFDILAKQYPQHQFYFLFDQPIHNELAFAENVHTLVVTPPARNPLRWKYWYDLKVPLALRKIRADVFVSLDGGCSLTTRLPQCLLVPDLGFLFQPQAYKKSHYRFFKKNTPRFLDKAKVVMTVSGDVKDEMIREYRTDPGKIRVVNTAARESFHPLPFEQQAGIKEKYTGGKEFFLAVNITRSAHLVPLLKAFSFFKKRQRSQMKLVLLDTTADREEATPELLKTYKYRDEVVMVQQAGEAELPRLFASAYALVHPTFRESFSTAPLDAMNCDVPVLLPGLAEERYHDAALYINPGDYSDVADKLMLIYKDEDLRKRLVEKGKLLSGQYTWQTTASLVWEAIIQAVGED